MAITAVILAAGRGSRLAPSGQEESFSKPLIRVSGQTLLERTVGCCRQAGVERIVVVTGFQGAAVEGEVARIDRGDLQIVHNPDWHKANGLSLYACRDVVKGDFALMMSDHVFDPSILTDLLAADRPEGSVVLAVDRKIDSIFDLDDATKVRIEDGRIAGISKQLEEYDAADCGLFACTPAIFDALGQVYSERGDCSLSEGMQIIAARGGFLPFDIGARWWQDVDTPDMLEQAIELLDRVLDEGSAA